MKRDSFRHREKITGFVGCAPKGVHQADQPNTLRGISMEAERINTIRSQLDDLTTRVVELRRYL